MSILSMLICTTLLAAPETPATQPATRPTTRPDQSARVAKDSVVDLDVAYVKDPAPKQKLDVYSPRDAKDAPVVLFVHGGEWARHDKSEVSFKPKFFNERGVVFVSVNYRLSDTDKHPAQVNDVAAAARWTRDNIGRYGGSGRKIVLMGHSAGCHLVTLVALDPKYLNGVGMEPADLMGVVSWSGGAFDLPAKVKEGGMYAGYIKINFGEDEKCWRDASPLAHVGDARATPDFLFASAENGNAASREISEKMASLVRGAGGRAETVLLGGRDHFYSNYEVGNDGDLTGPELVRLIERWSAERH